MTIDEITQKLSQGELRWQELGRMAFDHEQQARGCRAEMTTLKIELAELRQQVHNAGVRATMEKSLAVAASAQAKAEKSAADSESLRAELAAKLVEVNEMLESQKAAKTPPKEPTEQ